MRLAICLLVFAPFAFSFNPQRIEYCNLRCAHNHEISSGCFCIRTAHRHEITDHMGRFRQTILDMHNDLRNRLARGDDKEDNYPPASNMHILNYDLELEYLARCYLTSTRFVDGPDLCRAASYCTPYPPSQNLFGSPAKNTSLEFVKEVVRSWYEERNNIDFDKRKELMERYHYDEWNSSHFTQVIWAEMRRIGCVRVWLPKNNAEEWRFVVGCNYAGPKDVCTANIVDTPVYEAGKPCTGCKKDKECNSEEGGPYDALCGIAKAVPTVTPRQIGRGGQSAGQKVETVIHRHIKKYLQEEYEDQVVPVFFDNGSSKPGLDTVLAGLISILWLRKRMPKLISKLIIDPRRQ